MEASATYMEDEAYPDVNRNYNYLPFWFEYCDTYGLESAEREHEYGSFIFAKRLSEDFGDEIIREIWQEMAKSDGLVAIDNVLRRKNSSLISAFSKFITANFFLEDMYVDGVDYRMAVTGKTTFNGVWIEYQYDASKSPTLVEVNKTNVNYDAWMDKWATDYITLKLDPERQKYRISFDGLDLTTNYLVKLATKKEGVINEIPFLLDERKDGSIELSYDNFQNVTLIIANAGNTTTSNPSWRLIIEAIEIAPIYDVAVIDVKPSTYSAFTEQTINISVTVQNNGNVRSESFNISVWWGALSIGNETVIELPPATKKALNFNWKIPNWLNGSETVWANITSIPGEANLENNLFRDGMLEIRSGLHDLAITDIIPAKNIVKQGEKLNIEVLVENQGNYTETSNLTLYANNSIIQTETLTIQAQASTTITFSWNTTALE
jgi:hypothetical protein